MPVIKSGNRKVEITHPDREIFPDASLTKKDMVEYYQRISSYLLPYAKDRPMVLHRYPSGIHENDFYQKQEPDYFPDWIDTVTVQLRSKNRKQELVNCNSEATLLYIANQGCVTPHVWLSTQDSIEKPDRMIFDLDPPDDDFGIVKQGARDLKRIFDRLEMVSFLMTTGSSGLHVVLPLDQKSEYEQVREFARKVAEKLSREESDRYTTEMRKEKRKGRLFLDYLRNSFGQTAVAPYSLRARPGAPVATPLKWEELNKKKLNARTYHHGNIFRRLGAMEDPWKGFGKTLNSITQAAEKL